MPAQNDDAPRLTLIGKLFLAIFLAVCAGGAWWLFTKDSPKDQSSTGTESKPSASGNSQQTTVRIAYGTEKKRWITWAVDEFKKTSKGKDIAIDLLPMGSIEGARATALESNGIHVWSPASSAYLDTFKSQWEMQHSSGDPIEYSEELALSPMVFVMWKDRYDAFLGKFQTLDFSTISQGLSEAGGWESIAQKPQWGFFKFGHTNPNESNSGLFSLILMAHHYHNKTTPLTMRDIVNPEFQTWLKTTEGAVSGLINSTGSMMRDMVLKGPSTYDAIFVYENVAIDYLKNAEGRWGQLHVSYPAINMWNNNPYYIIKAPWCSTAEKKAARTFLDFLMSDPIQQKSLEHGFRPGNANIAINSPESPFTLYEKYGLKIDLPSVAEPPKGDAISSLLTGWQRIRSAN